MKTNDEKGSQRNPPRMAEWLLERLVPRGAAGRSILGDAREEHANLVGSGSRVKAFFRYWGVVFSIGLYFLGRNIPRDMFYDVRLAIRSLVRRPLFAVASMGTLAVGIGAATTVFSIAYGILWPLSGLKNLALESEEQDPSFAQALRAQLYIVF